MIKFEINADINIFHESLKDKVDEIYQKEVPNFANYCVNLKALGNIEKETKNFKNIILCSDSGFEIEMLKDFFPEKFKKNIIVVEKGNAEKIKFIRNNFSTKDSLLIFVSKKSNEKDIATLLSLKEFPTILITTPQEHCLFDIASKKELTILDLPTIKEEFYTATIATALPLKIAGFPLEEFLEGVKEAHEKFSNKVSLEKNLAMQAALAFFILESKHFTEVFFFLSNKLEPLKLVIEEYANKICNSAKGQTFIGFAQKDSGFIHRLINGRKNAILFKIENEEEDITIRVPKEFFALTQDTAILHKIDGISLNSLDAELNNFLPRIVLKLFPLNAFTIGEFIGFMHWFYCYSRWLRNI